jgi:hypothetical protein
MKARLKALWRLISHPLGADVIPSDRALKHRHWSEGDEVYEKLRGN